MRHNARPFFCIAAAALLSGCAANTVEIRPVAPVVELRAAPLVSRGAMAAPPAMTALPRLNGASAISRQDSSGPAEQADTPPGVQVEAVIPGVYSGRSLSFERDAPPK